MQPVCATIARPLSPFETSTWNPLTTPYRFNALTVDLSNVVLSVDVATAVEATGMHMDTILANTYDSIHVYKLYVRFLEEVD